MVAIVKCTQEEQEHIEFYERIRGTAFPEWTWTTNRLRKLWPSGAHLTLIVTDSHMGESLISRLAWTKPVRRVDDLNEKLEISRINSVKPPLPLEELLNAVPQQNQRHVRAEGQQPAGTGKAMLTAMLKLRPGWQEAVENIEGFTRQYPTGNSNAAQVLSLQRDASIGISRMAGIDISDFSEWSPPPDPLTDNSVPPTFMSGLPEQPAHEDQLINQDMQMMLGWVSDATTHVNWRVFNQHGQYLLIVNANREPAEQVLGVDIIYYNMIRESLVLVQYKKLDAAKRGFYYPKSDASLGKELLRMRAVDRYAEAHRRPGDDFRLLSSPSWLKICYPQPAIPHSNDMIHGMYLAREHFEQLYESDLLKSQKGATRFGYQNLPNYLDNTMFTKLVETGLIGTAGTSTDLVHKQIIRSFTGKKALALGVLTGNELPQSERNQQRRKRRK